MVSILQCLFIIVHLDNHLISNFAHKAGAKILRNYKIGNIFSIFLI